VKVTATNVARVDLSVADRPVESVDYKNAPVSVALRSPVPAAGGRILARGFRQGQLVVSARLT